jgi:glycerol-3-phosphate dehydrogenase subunit C
MFTNAFIDEARALAQRNAAELSACVERGSTIVTTCPSCGLALRSEYDDLLGVEGPASLVWDLFELLEFEEKDPFRKVELKLDRAYYHVPCHLRSLGAGAPAARFLARYAVRDLKVSDEYCCGLAGTFGFKKEKFALSMEIGGPLFDAVRKSGAPLAITDCGTCALQIALGAGVEVKHPAVVMRELL